MIIHYDQVILKDDKYYFKKNLLTAPKLVTARVLFFSTDGHLECDFNFKEGVFNGLQKLYKDINYQLSSEENYKNGVLDGISLFYHENKLTKELSYKDGILNSKKIF